MNNYEKLKDIKNEDFRVEKEYMNEKAMDTARMAFSEDGEKHKNELQELP